MMSFLGRLLKAPYFEDEEKTRVAQLLHVILLTYLLSTGLFLIVLPLTSPDMIERGVVALVFLPSILLMFRLMHYGHVRLAAFILLALNWTILATFALNTSGVSDSSYTSQILLIFFAGFLLGRRAVIGLVIVDLALGLVMIAMQNAGIIVPVDYSPMATWYSIGTIFVGVAIVILVISRNIENTLTRANDEIQRRTRAETIMRESEEKYRQLIEYSPQGIVIASPSPLRLSFVSQSVETITGYTQQQLLAFTEEQIAELIHPDDRDGLFHNMAQVLVGESVKPRFRQRIVKQDGSLCFVDIYSVKIDYQGEPATQTVFMDVTAQVEAERMKARFQKEHEHNTLIQRVISMLSHDLRTPLAVIQTSYEYLHRYHDQMTDDKRKEKLDTIQRQVQFALELLDDTVNIARGNLNEREFDPRPINLATLCQVSVNEISAMQKRSIVFINRGNVEQVAVDEVLFSRILLNLISNAIKYSPDGGEIRLELDYDAEWIVLQVTDQGIGISETDIPHIFDPFYRAGDVRTVSGTGLGLSIVQDCVTRHHGKISVTSTPGNGTTFTVQLPLNTPAPQPIG